MIYEKLKRLRELKRELAIEEKLLDYYTKNAPQGKVTFAMKLADEANRQAYSHKKWLIENLEKEICTEGEIVNLHFTIPDLPSGMMPLTAFNHFTHTLEKTLSLIGEDIMQKARNGSGRKTHQGKGFYTPALQLIAMRAGSFTVQLGALNDPESLFFGSKEDRKINILYQSGTRLLNILYTLGHRENLERLSEENDDILESVATLYQNMNKDQLSLDITWNRHPTYRTFTIPHQDTASIAHALEDYITQRQKSSQILRLTGTITALSMAKYTLLLKKKDGPSMTIRITKDDIPALMAHEVNPLYQKEYTLYVTCENKPKGKCVYQLDHFEE